MGDFRENVILKFTSIAARNREKCLTAKISSSTVRTCSSLYHKSREIYNILVHFYDCAKRDRSCSTIIIIVVLQYFYGTILVNTILLVRVSIIAVI